MTGYQEIMTDPSYAGQSRDLYLPPYRQHGVTPEDDETGDPVAAGMVVKWDPTEPSNWRCTESWPMAGRAWPHRHRRRRHPAPDPRHPPARRAPCRAGP